MLAAILHLRPAIKPSMNTLCKLQEPALHIRMLLAIYVRKSSRHIPLSLFHLSVRRRPLKSSRETAFRSPVHAIIRYV
jgi:hypothetical protein